MKAIIRDSEIDITVEDVVITGQTDTMLSTLVNWNTAETNVNIIELLKVRQAGFNFYIKNGRCYFTTRKCSTEFIADMPYEETN